MSDLITITEYAKRRGISDAAVHQALKDGRIEAITVNGKRLIHEDLADRQWRERTQHSKARRKQTASAKLQSSSPAAVAAEAPPAPTPVSFSSDASGDASYMDARTRREAALAQLAELELAKSSQRLVDRDRVATAAMRLGRLLRDAILGLPTQLSPELAAMTDPLTVEARLTEALRQVLDDVSRLTAQDLEGLLGADLS